jgi:thiol-disulfide isomerase/thioredoxin
MSTEKTSEVDPKNISEVDPKNIINVSVYNIFDNLQIETYTATWCKPCCNVKPHVLEYLKDYELVRTYDIEKPEFKTNINQFVPFFRVRSRAVEDSEWSSIQTSDPEKFREFMNSLKVIDEDF